jgi:peptidoglycan biosynthesis protein MviN/MurJ (putative lipid II flippase)
VVAESQQPKRSIGDRILRAGFLVLLAHVLVNISSYVLRYWISNEYAAEVADVYNTIWSSVIATAFYFGEQCLGPAYLPVFTSAREKDGEARAWHYTSIIFNTQALMLMAIIAAFVFFPARIINTLTQWGSSTVKLTTVVGTDFQADVVAIGEGDFTLRTIDPRFPAELSSYVQELGPGAAPAPAQSVSDSFTPAAIGTILNVPDSALRNPESIETEISGRRDRFNLAVKMLPWSALGLLGMSLASLTYMLLNAYKEFFWAAFGDAAIKLAIFAGALSGTIAGKGNWRYIAGGIVLGGVAKLLTHVLALNWNRVRQFRLTLNLADPYFRAFMALVLPLLAGIAISRFRDMVVYWALTAKGGLPTSYSNGRNVSGAVNQLIPYALSIALLPYFCDISARNDNKQLGEVLTRIIRMLVWFFVPLSIIMAAGALPICLTLYAGKNIQLDDSKLSAVIVQIFCVEMIFAAIEMMVMQAFFSSRRMIAPTIAGLLFSSLTAAAAYILVDRGFVTEKYSIIMAIALCLVLARVFKAIVLVSMLKWTVPVLPIKETLGFVIRTATAGVAAAAGAWGTAAAVTRVIPMIAGKPAVAEAGAKALMSMRERACHAGEVAAIGIVGAAIYLAVSLALNMNEPREFWQWTREKLRRRRGGSSQPSPAAQAL